jgi:hypothetical protein
MISRGGTIGKHKREMRSHPEAILSASLALSPRGSMLSVHDIALVSAAVCRSQKMLDLPVRVVELLLILDLVVIFVRGAAGVKTGAGARIFRHAAKPKRAPVMRPRHAARIAPNGRQSLTGP